MSELPNAAVTFAKVDEERQLVYGWASVIEVDGTPVVDFQGDVIEESDLIDAAHGFMTDFRRGGEMHEARKTIGKVVESLVFTKSLQWALGIDLGKVGWLIAVKVDDPAVWKKVKDGEYRGFSIGGSGIRIPAEAE